MNDDDRLGRDQFYRFAQTMLALSGAMVTYGCVDNWFGVDKTPNRAAALYAFLALGCLIVIMVTVRWAHQLVNEPPDIEELWKEGE